MLPKENAEAAAADVVEVVGAVVLLATCPNTDWSGLGRAVVVITAGFSATVATGAVVAATDGVLAGVVVVPLLDSPNSDLIPSPVAGAAAAVAAVKGDAAGDPNMDAPVAAPNPDPNNEPLDGVVAVPLAAAVVAVGDAVLPKPLKIEGVAVVGAVVFASLSTFPPKIDGAAAVVVLAIVVLVPSNAPNAFDEKMLFWASIELAGEEVVAGGVDLSFTEGEQIFKLSNTALSFNGGAGLVLKSVAWTAAGF